MMCHKCDTIDDKRQVCAVWYYLYSFDRDHHLDAPKNRHDEVKYPGIRGAKNNWSQMCRQEQNATKNVNHVHTSLVCRRREAAITT